MTNRRRLLLSYLANSFKYLPYSYEYLYYGLVPTTIDSKQVRNKAKVSKLYGNSVVENQLLAGNGTSETINGITFTHNGDGSITVSGTATANTNHYFTGPTDGVKANHTYLLKGCPNGGGSNSFTLYCTGSLFDRGSGGIFTFASKQQPSCRIEIANGYSFSTPKTFFPQLTDLTQKYPFDTPTTLTDNRVQAILNRGYIPFNLGELKSVDIGEISSEDSNNNPLSTITFKYQGSGVGTAHDTYELTKTAHVFTKNISRVDLGTQNWTYETVASGDNYYTDIIENALKNSSVLCTRFGSDTNVSPATLRNNAWVSASGRINITADGYNGNTTTFKTAMSGVMLEYPLATSQVITIPRKHLGVVDLGSLTWYYDSESGHETMFSEVVNNIAKPSSSDVMANIYTNKYLSANWSNLYSHNGKNIIAIQGNGIIRVYADDMGTNASDFKTSLSGVYLWYETEDEVADITDTFDIQSGGTINTDSNVLPNADFLMKCK